MSCENNCPSITFKASSTFNMFTGFRTLERGQTYNIGIEFFNKTVNALNKQSYSPLQGKSIAEVLNRYSSQSGFTLSLNFDIISGAQQCSGSNTITFLICNSSNSCRTASINNSTNTNYKGLSASSGSINIRPSTLSVISENCNVTNFQGTITFNFSFEISCCGGITSNPLCIQYCDNSISSNKPDSCCLEYYNSTCFKDSPSSINPKCVNFYETYSSNFGGNSNLDDLLNNYCKKYSSIKDLLENATTDDIKLCSCHLSLSQYENYANELDKLYPSLSNLGIPNICLFEQCVFPGIKTASIPRSGCPLPACIEVASFNNNGTFDGNVTIKQSAKCAQITGGTGTNGGNTNNQSNTRLIIIALIFVIIIILIIITTIFIV